MLEFLEDIRAICIDDDPGDLELLRRYLARATQLSVDYCGFTNVPDAVREMELGERFDVAIVDYHLGAETGIEALEALRAIDPGLPAIMLTGRSDDKVVGLMVRSGVGDFFMKDKLNAEGLQRSVLNVASEGRLKRELEEQRLDLKEAVEKLRVREQENSSFYHVVSHELKTPLTAISEFISITLDGLGGDLTDDQKDYLGVAHKNCLHLKEMLNDLIDVSRIETGKLRIEGKPMDVERWIRDTTPIFERQAKEADLGLVVNTEADLPEVLGDENRLLQVLNNLLCNAVKFTPAGGQITVTTKTHPEDPSMLAVSVTDTGCGIKPKHKDKVFERLYQARESDTTINGGLGLGLNLCKGLVESHGGTLWVESEPGNGSCFTFTIPLAVNSTTSQSPA
ncbi:MAG: response regulator [bacterium]|nr:response regulator [bacterium]